MKKSVHLLITLCTIAFFAGCSLKGPDPVFQRDAINIIFESSDDINSYGGEAHSLVLVVYQLSDINPFLKLAKTPDGISTLLAGQQFDKSVTAFNSYIVLPSTERQIMVNRAQESQYVAIVAGYYNILNPLDVARVYTIPVYTPPWWKFWDYTRVYENFNMTLFVSKSAIHGELEE